VNKVVQMSETALNIYTKLVIQMYITSRNVHHEELQHDHVHF